MVLSIIDAPNLHQKPIPHRVSEPDLRLRVWQRAGLTESMSHVLIIEDEMLIAMHLESLITDIADVTIDLAATEGEAVGMARARPPSLILSDVRLAEGTGPAAVSAIRDMLGKIPVIYVTGNPDPIDDDAPVLTKPVHDDLLRATASAMLTRSPSAPLQTSAVRD
jgi:CheY-like chemotaxis protein